MRLIEGVWSTTSVHIMCRPRRDERRSEIEQAFEVVRGGQLHWFLAYLLHVCRILTCPKLGGEWHLEAEEIRRSSGGFRPRRSWKLHAYCFSFAFGRASVQSEELIASKLRKITRDNPENEFNWTLFIWLSLSGFWGWSHDLRYLWNISWEHFRLTEIDCYKLQTM